MESKLLRIKDVVFDEELYPRVNWSWQTAYDYSQSMRSGAKFPPIAVALYENKYYLMDGKHRIEANRNLKEEFIQVEITKNLTREQIYQESIKRNNVHGRQFSPYEKRLIILKLKDMKYSIDKITDLIGIPLDKIEAFTYKTVTQTLTTGENIVLKAPFYNIAKDNIKVDDNFDFLQSVMNASSQLNVLQQVNVILENDMLDVKNKKVNEEFKKLKELVLKVK